MIDIQLIQTNCYDIIVLHICLIFSLSISSKLLRKLCDLSHVFKRDRVWYRVVGCEHIASAFLHGRDDTLHFRFHKLNIIPYLRIDAAVKRKLVAIFLPLTLICVRSIR